MTVPIAGDSTTSGATGSGFGAAGGVSGASSGAGLGTAWRTHHKGTTSLGETTNRLDRAGAYDLFSSWGATAMWSRLRSKSSSPETLVAAFFQIAPPPSRLTTPSVTRSKAAFATRFSAGSALQMTIT